MRQTKLVGLAVLILACVFNIGYFALQAGKTSNPVWILLDILMGAITGILIITFYDVWESY